jgi:hypothetical protein
MERFLRLLIAGMCAWLLATPAHAYIDPNAGGVLFQLLAPLFAALVGGWIFLRRWIAASLRRLWQRLLAFKSK